MRRPHVVLASHEVAPLVRAGGIGRHVAFAAALLAPEADVTVVVPSGLRGERDRLEAEGSPLLEDGVTLHVAAGDPGERARFTSSFHADAAEVARAVADIHADRPVDLVEVDDYLGLGAVLVDAAAARWRGLDELRLTVRLHTTWEMAQVLDGASLSSAAARWVCALERRALRAADVLVAPAAATEAAYRRFYGDAALAPTTILRPAPLPAAPRPDARAPGRSSTGPLRVLYVGRLQELKGVRAIVEAVVDSSLDVVLSVAGGDTLTAPSGGSMREHLEDLAGDDARVELLGQLQPRELDDAYRAADLVVVPSRFESFGYVLREALAHGRPVLATPMAGFAELLSDPRAGWLAEGFGPEALRDGLERVLAERERLAELLASGAPREVVDREAHREGWAASQLALATGRPSPSAAPAASGERATAIVPATGGDLERTLAALAAQTETLEIVVTADSAARVPPALLEHVDALVLCGADEALDRGLLARRSRGPVLFLRAGEWLDPAGVARLRAVLDGPREPAYATAWGTGRQTAARPLGGSEARLVADFDAAGSVALLSPGAAALAARHGADPVTRLVRGGADGVVLPEVLLAHLRSRSPKPAVEAAGRAFSVFSSGHELWDPGASGKPAERPAQHPGQDRDL